MDLSFPLLESLGITFSQQWTIRWENNPESHQFYNCMRYNSKMNSSWPESKERNKMWIDHLKQQ